MDAFFVACEVRRRPELRGKAVVVGGTGSRGVVAAASYEARQFGVFSAMPSVRAAKLCPQAIFITGDHALYDEVSRHVLGIFSSFTPLVEPLSLDEAFLDVTGVARLFGDGPSIAAAIRQRVLDELGLSCSVGVAPTKFLAKLASEAAKPKATATAILPGAGVTVVRVGAELAFLHPLPVQALWGVGPKTLEKLQRLGISSVGELASLPLATLVSTLGRASGQHLHGLAQGRDERHVEPDRVSKSVGHEQTFATDLDDPVRLDHELVRMSDAVASRLRRAAMMARTVQLKVRFSDFSTITRSHTLADGVSSAHAILTAARLLLAQVDPSAGVRLLGVSVSQLNDGTKQLSLDVDESDEGPAWDEASRTIDDIRRRFGDSSIGPASLVQPEGLRLLRRGQQQWGPNALE